MENDEKKEDKKKIERPTEEDLAEERYEPFSGYDFDITDEEIDKGFKEGILRYTPEIPVDANGGNKYNKLFGCSGVYEGDLELIFKAIRYMDRFLKAERASRNDILWFFKVVGRKVKKPVDVPIQPMGESSGPGLNDLAAISPVHRNNGGVNMKKHFKIFDMKTGKWKEDEMEKWRDAPATIKYAPVINDEEVDRAFEAAEERWADEALERYLESLPPKPTPTEKTKKDTFRSPPPLWD